MEHLKQKVSVLIDHLQMRNRMLLFAFERSLGDNGTEDEHGEWGCGELANEADPHHKPTVIFLVVLHLLGSLIFNGPLFLCCVRSLQRAALPPGLRRPPLELLRDTLGRHFVMSLCVARCQNGIKKLLIIAFRKWPAWRMLWGIY